MLSVPVRVLVACLVVVLASFSSPASAQDPPPPIPWFVVDLHASIPKFPSDDVDLANSRGMNPGEFNVVQLGSVMLSANGGWEYVPVGVGFQGDFNDVLGSFC